MRHETASIGHGTRAAVLFHEAPFDSAVVELDPLAEFPQEINSTGTSLLYVVLAAQDNTVELELVQLRQYLKYSAGSDIIVPIGATYTLRNLSRRVPAKLIAVVPRRTS